MNIPCPACSSGPSGPVGHDALMACSMGPTGISLQCRSCQALWQRTPDLKLGFVWTALDDRAALNPLTGVAVLPRSTASVGCLLPMRKDPDFDRFVATVLGEAVGESRHKRKRS